MAGVLDAQAALDDANTTLADKEAVADEAVSKLGGGAVTSADVQAMRESGMGWGEICHELGVHPSVLGLAKGKDKNGLIGALERVRNNFKEKIKNAVKATKENHGNKDSSAKDNSGVAKGKDKDKSNSGNKSGGNKGGNSGGGKGSRLSCNLACSRWFR